MYGDSEIFLAPLPETSSTDRSSFSELQISHADDCWRKGFHPHEPGAERGLLPEAIGRQWKKGHNVPAGIRLAKIGGWFGMCTLPTPTKKLATRP